MLKFYTLWGGAVSLLGGGQAPPGVRVILTLVTLDLLQAAADVCFRYPKQSCSSLTANTKMAAIRPPRPIAYLSSPRKPVFTRDCYLVTGLLKLLIKYIWNFMEHCVYYIGDVYLTWHNLFQANNWFCLRFRASSCWKPCEITIICHNSVSCNITK